MVQIMDSLFAPVSRSGEFDCTARALKAMSHPLRLKILCILGEQEVSVQNIVDRAGSSQSNISQHLAILRENGLLVTRKEANRIYYRVGDARILQIIGLTGDIFCTSTSI